MPSCCNNDTCEQSFVNQGLGSSIINEIKRDKLATDLLISVVGLAFHPPEAPVDFYPSPDKYGIKVSEEFFTNLPSMRTICDSCNTDNELIDLIGLDNFKALRFHFS